MKLTNQQKFNLRQKISKYAKKLGFDLVGFSKAKVEDEYLRAFKKWIKNGYEADMSYMRKISKRCEIDKILPGAKTVIVLGMNYYHEQPPLPRGSARVARYAYGRDYHKVIGKKLKELEKFIGGKSYVDTGPILERAFAEQSGLGRIGKNGCLITKKFGSWIFIGEIITTLDLNIATRLPAGTQAQYQKSSYKKNGAAVFCSSSPFPGIVPRNSAYVSRYSLDFPPQGGQKPNGTTIASSRSCQSTTSSRWSDPSQKPFNICGNCTRCITACPTGAIIAPGIIDSRLCISYLTIENRKKIPPRLAKIIKKTKRIFGCDICQEVCPHRARQRSKKINSHSTKNRHPDLLNGLLTPIAGHSLNLKKLLRIQTDKQFLTLFAGSPLMRAKRKGIQRTAKILKN